MRVLKRDGREEPVAFDKITSRIKKLCYGLNPEYVDVSCFWSFSTHTTGWVRGKRRGRYGSGVPATSSLLAVDVCPYVACTTNGDTSSIPFPYVLAG